jgi:hypothetical protein
MTYKKAENDRGFEIIFNTLHGKNTIFLIMQEFLGGWHLSHENGTCYDQHLNAIYDAIKAAKVKNAGKPGNNHASPELAVGGGNNA